MRLASLLILSLLPAAALAAPEFGPAEITFSGKPAPAASSSACGFRFIAAENGPQVAVMGPPWEIVMVLRKGEEVTVKIPVLKAYENFNIETDYVTECAESPLGCKFAFTAGEPNQFCEIAGSGMDSIYFPAAVKPLPVCFKASARAAWATVRWRVRHGTEVSDLPLVLPPRDDGRGPPPVLPEMREEIQRAMIEWDWRMQDGIGTARAANTYEAAIRRTLERGDRLFDDLGSAGAPLADLAKEWQAVHLEPKRLKDEQAAWDAKYGNGKPPQTPLTKRLDWRTASALVHGFGGFPFAENRARQWMDSIEWEYCHGYPQCVRDSDWEALWLRAHQLRRRIALANPLFAKLGPVLFAKQVPGAFSHQLTQYYGRYAKPGGGLFVLDELGKSMACRSLTAGKLPEGSYQHPEVSWDGRRILFSYVAADTAPQDGVQGQAGRYYHLYEMAADGSGLRQLTDGPFNDFAPKVLPNGQIVFISTRRMGWHRCGAPGCENYTLALAEADGSRPRPISFHETQEWDPAVLADGRVVYTRWDYVDRHAVYYEQLWAVHPDGSAPTAFYGNNTFNPVGTWEARPVPGSNKIIATAAAHHAMTAGSIILLDVSKGIDGLGPITRLTPDALFPESEGTVLPGWRGQVPPDVPPPSGPDVDRWPGQCYRSPWPLSEKYFLAAYSFDPLVGEAKANAANMFGIYLVDAFGNKELLYRDPNIASLWPVAMAARARPPVLAGVGAQGEGVRSLNGAGLLTPAPAEGTYFVQNVYESEPALPRGSVKRLRIVQLVPKSTPGINNPSVGAANASPGKQVLGTVPVEADGSAYFRAPANLPLSFQALDELGQAVQVMRSVTYLQPGENAGCVGCHEPRTTAPPARAAATALTRGPSTIAPGPEGSRPLSYVRLVQPVLDKQCVSCHSAAKPDGGVILTGEPQGHYTASYNALVPRVPYSYWGAPGDFRQTNSEPVARPDFFGARGSKLMKLLLKGHEKVTLAPDEIERLATWMDANALFYGTFDPADQARQQKGELIAGPKLQ